MTDLYTYLNAKKGYKYKDDEITENSFLKIYPVIDTTRELRGNSRITGDADKNVQDRIIDMLITISSRYSLSYKEIAYILLITKVESGFNPDAAAGTTSASGLAQGTTNFADDTFKNSKDILGFSLDITGEKIFDAEKGCYAVVYSFLINKSKVSEHYTAAQTDYWRWLYILHHDGVYSLKKYLAGKRKISYDGNKWANYIIERLPVVEKLLKSHTVNTSFKLSTGDGTPIVNKDYIVTLSIGADSSHPSIVSNMKNPLIFLKGKTDHEGKTEAINALTGAEIIFTILQDNYKKLAMSGNISSPGQMKKEEQKNSSSSNNANSNTTYTVKSGDTLSEIAKLYGKTINELAKFNQLSDVNVLHVGQILKLTDSSKSDHASNISFNYISRYVKNNIKQAIIKYLGIENGNARAAMSYVRSHIVLPNGSISADVDNNKNVIHIKTTKKSDSLKNKKRQPEKHKTDDKGTVKPTTAHNEFEPVIIFAKGIRADLVSEKTINILKEILKNSSIHKATISSTFRTPIRQARAMYENMVLHGVASQLAYYKPNGKAVIQAGIDAGGVSPDKKQNVIAAMVRKIDEIHQSGGIVSRHCVDEETYKKKNVIDIGKRSLDQCHLSRKFDECIIDYTKTHSGIKYINPFTNRGESAFHLEIEQ